MGRMNLVAQNWLTKNSFIHPHRQDEAGTAFNAVCYDSEQGIERVERLAGIKPCGKVSTRYFNV